MGLQTGLRVELVPDGYRLKAKHLRGRHEVCLKLKRLLWFGGMKQYIFLFSIKFSLIKVEFHLAIVRIFKVKNCELFVLYFDSHIFLALHCMK